jgi:RNase adapter protein RapZ
MHLVIISGMSGAGKSVALNVLEDLGFYCSDNLPAGLLRTFVDELSSSGDRIFDRVGVGIDARNLSADVERIPALVQELRAGGLSCEIIFLQAKEDVLLSRFSETRRRHPLSDRNVGLLEAIIEERKLLAPIIDAADLIIDTSATTTYDLREQISERIAGREPHALSILIESFGYKHGLPGDADFVFDVRCLPNPYWEPELKPLTGLDEPVRAFLDAQPRVQEMIDDIAKFLESWIPRYQDFQRSYLTVAIGCTGGQHRSVYVTEAIAKRLGTADAPIRTRHHELSR